ncbi:hypothetical protein CEXT_704031 [Caerostris extrusa]|uniref:Cation-transporting P-type ATPase N-terminal domain-containing protein n=1 Tax=Caerostris extrusa TaxID=172846 RepID=A0AAV4TND8_CAEEX|nr:hypothetical protein CEXT_704031 [Caerostris extrusa]
MNLPPLHERFLFFYVLNKFSKFEPEPLTPTEIAERSQIYGPERLLSVGYMTTYLLSKPGFLLRKALCLRIFMMLRNLKTACRKQRSDDLKTQRIGSFLLFCHE